MTNCPSQGGVIFIAIRGSKYGWIPTDHDLPTDLWTEWPQGESIQSAEIRCALALGNGASRGIIFYRTDVNAFEEPKPGSVRAKLVAEKQQFEVESGVSVRTYSGTEGGLQDEEGIAEFEALVRAGLEGVLDDWCGEVGMPRPLWEIGRAELQKDAASMEGPSVKRASKRNAALALTAGKEAITCPTFRQTVAWRCHLAMTERLSRSYFGNERMLRLVQMLF